MIRLDRAKTQLTEQRTLWQAGFFALRCWTLASWIWMFSVLTTNAQPTKPAFMSLVAKIPRPSGTCTLALNPDGSLLALASGHHEIQLFRRNQSDESYSLWKKKSMSSPIGTGSGKLQFSDDGKLLILVDRLNRAQMFQITDDGIEDGPVLPLEVSAGGVSAISPRGDRIAFWSPRSTKSISIYSTATGAQVELLNELWYPANVEALSFSNDSSQLIVIQPERGVLIDLSVTGGSPIQTTTWPFKLKTNLFMTSSGRHLCDSEVFQKGTVIDVTNNATQEFSYERAVVMLDVSPDGQWVATLSKNILTFQSLDQRTKSRLMVGEETQKWCAIAFSKTGGLVALAQDLGEHVFVVRYPDLESSQNSPEPKSGDPESAKDREPTDGEATEGDTPLDLHTVGPELTALWSRC